MIYYGSSREEHLHKQRGFRARCPGRYIVWELTGNAPRQVTSGIQGRAVTLLRETVEMRLQNVAHVIKKVYYVPSLRIRTVPYARPYEKDISTIIANWSCQLKDRNYCTKVLDTLSWYAMGVLCNVGIKMLGQKVEMTESFWSRLESKGCVK